MKKNIIIFSTFMLLVFSIFLFKINVLANPIGENWTKFNEKYNVSLEKSWKINFSDKVSLDKIDGIVIERNNNFIPVDIDIINNTTLTITPINNYESNSRYCLKIFLNNNKKYYMYFNTVKEEVYSLGKDINYMNFEKSNITSNFTTIYDKKIVEPEESNIIPKKQLKDNIGNTYSNGVTFCDSDGISSMALEYPLQNKFRKFKGIIGVESSWKIGKGSVSVKIYADDDKIYEKSWKPSYFPENINLDVSGAKKLRIEVDGKGFALEKHNLSIYNPILIK